MTQLNLPQQTLDDANLINVVRLIMSCLRLQNDGTGDLDIITNPEALPLAQTFWDAYASEVGVSSADPTNVTGQEYALCIFKKLRKVFKDAHIADALKTPKANYRAAVETAEDTASTEVNDAVGE